MTKKPATPIVPTISALREDIREDVRRAKLTGMSLRDIAAKLGVSRWALGRILDGENDLKLSTLEKIHQPLQKITRQAVTEFTRKASDLARARARYIVPFAEFITPAVMLAQAHGFALHERFCLFCDMVRVFA